MKSRCSSTPRMQQVYTPRVKDGRRSNDAAQVHDYNKTAPKFNPNPNSYSHFNPEASPPNAKVQNKVVQANIQQAIDQKINLDLPPQVKQQNQNNKNQKNRPAQKNQHNSIQGRKLEYPVAEKGAGFSNANEKRPQTANIQRSNSMYSSVHYVDRGVKSSSIKEQKKEFDDKFKTAFGYLLDQNEAYLKQCRRTCNQKARPKDEIFKVKRPTITTTNKEEYREKSTPYAQHMDPLAQTVSNSFGPRKVCGNSTSNEFHGGKTGPRADLAEWPDHYKLQGPLFGVTNYANQFPHPGDYEKMIPVVTFNEHPLGLPHKANSTSRTHFKGEFTKKAELATWNNLHPYGNDFNPGKNTTYDTMHNFKDNQPTQTWPMYEPRLIQSNGKFTTEAGSKLLDPSKHQLSRANYCDCGRKGCRH